MKEIRCPFCGRENTRGKYCMFCGNPLAGGQTIRTRNDASDKQEEGQRWDPEMVYVRSRGKAIAILAAVIVLIACVAVVFITQPHTEKKPWRAFAAPIGTPDASSLKEMTEMLKEAGMKTIGDPYAFSDTRYQKFGPFVILEEESSYSVAAVQEEKEIAVAHVFSEEKGAYSNLKQGPVFNRLKEKLTKKYGQPIIRGTTGYYYWSQQGDVLVLYYSYNGELRLEFHEGISGTSI